MSGAQIRREVLRYRGSVDDAVSLSQQLVDAWRCVGEWRDLLQGVYQRSHNESIGSPDRPEYVKVI